MTTAADEAPRRRGRPAKAPADRKSANMKFRTRDDLREKVEEAAVAAGRSASEEVEWRLQQSFHVEPLMQMLFGNGRDATNLVNNVLSAVRTIQEYENPRGCQLGSVDWQSSDLTRAALRAALGTIVAHSVPEISPPADWEKPSHEQSPETLTLKHMENFGMELGKVLTGQLPNLERDLMRQGAAEH